ncbi:MAG: hypothetical protein ACRDIE_18870 [Chloroflexota bacterium]
MKRPPILAQLGLAILLGSSAGFALARHAAPSTANAEERGLRVPLTYVHGVSNWGPTNVRGSAVVWPLEGVAELSISLLPRLSHGDTYAWWVVNSATGDALRLASFNTSNAGDAHIDTYLTGTLPRQANMVLVTVSHPGDALDRPGATRSVSGYMVTPALPRSSGSGAEGVITPAARSGQAEKNGQPTAPFHVVALPRTGGGPGADDGTH